MQAATDARERILGVYAEKQPSGVDILSIEDALCGDHDLIERASTPDRRTLLHSFIKNYIREEWDYLRRKTDEAFPGSAQKILDEYKIAYSIKDIQNEDLNRHLYSLLDAAFDRISHEVFCLLFNDRALMRNFNVLVSGFISRGKQSDYPERLERDGILKRCTYWPKWLVDALLHREKGKCALCLKDLTGTIAQDRSIHIDHIVPISRSGTNDPTNLQILCDECNTRKGNRNNDTSELMSIPWNQP